jgi:hypothetical protein
MVVVFKRIDEEYFFVEPEGHKSPSSHLTHICLDDE